eukprot:jgi/Botrbrau1/2548/Bobra.0079s0035.1
MDINLRFRHAQGVDIGPLSLPDSLTVQELKDRLLAEWPKEGPLVKDMPNGHTEVTLILNGKVLENGAVLRDLRPVMGNPEPDTIVTFHVVVRPAKAGRGSGKGSEKGKKQGCGCCLQ